VETGPRRAAAAPPREEAGRRSNAGLSGVLVNVTIDNVIT
jgi:hypothetical protein